LLNGREKKKKNGEKKNEREIFHFKKGKKKGKKPDVEIPH
jgi:hypothetical protein